MTVPPLTVRPPNQTRPPHGMRRALPVRQTLVCDLFRDVGIEIYDRPCTYLVQYEACDKVAGIELLEHFSLA